MYHEMRCDFKFSVVARIQHGWAEPGMIIGISVVVSRKYQLVCESMNGLCNWQHLILLTKMCNTLQRIAKYCLKCCFTFLIWKHSKPPAIRWTSVSACEYRMSRLWSATLISALSSLRTTNQVCYFIHKSWFWTQASMLCSESWNCRMLHEQCCKTARQELDRVPARLEKSGGWTNP